MRPTDIPWADVGWSPLVGCLGTCGVTADNPKGWCFARNRVAPRLRHLCMQCGDFVPHLHSERLDEPLKDRRPAVVFADPFADWWSPGVKPEWRWDAIAGMSIVPHHRFVVLTKNPRHILGGDVKRWPSNAWLGVSITSGADWWRWEALASLPGHIHKLVSVEPLLSFGIGAELLKEQVVPEWICIGPQSGPGAVIPDATWQDMIRFAACDEWNIPLFEKFGLPLQPPVRQLPQELLNVFRKRSIYGI